MENILLKYMQERFNKDEISPQISTNRLPFITISREYGCPSKEIAKLLAHKINLASAESKQIQMWEVISKEILEEAGKELNVNTERIKKFLNMEKKNTIDEILVSLSEKYYHSDVKIKKTLSKIILDFALKGNVVIVGLGGIGVTHHIKHGFHVRLTAPIEWRIENLCDKGKCKTYDEARLLALEMDKKRNELIKMICKKEIDVNMFDITYNCSSFNTNNIAESIIYHMIRKGLIKFR